VFEDDEENKMEYMPIFKNYEKTIDGYIQGVRTADLSFQNITLRNALGIIRDCYF